MHKISWEFLKILKAVEGIKFYYALFDAPDPARGTLLNVKQEEEMITCELAIHNLSSILYL